MFEFYPKISCQIWGIFSCLAGGFVALPRSEKVPTWEAGVTNTGVAVPKVSLLGKADIRWPRTGPLHPEILKLLFCDWLYRNDINTR